jgi:hypothetical protein
MTMKSKRKYNYFAVIQSFHNGKWRDESFYPTNARFIIQTKDVAQLLAHDRRGYDLANDGGTRVINRREIAE